MLLSPPPSPAVPPSVLSAIVEAPCVSCGAPVAGAYCARCGERRASDRRYTVPAFLAEVAETFTNADSTLLRTMRTLLTRPGELTRAYMTGVRVPYMRPLQLFLIVNVIYFVWASWAGERVFSTRLFQHFGHSAYGATARAMVDRKVAAWQATAARARQPIPTREEYVRVFDAAAEVQARMLIITMLPMYALVLALVQLRRRRPFVQHLVFAAHVYTVLLLLAIAQRYVMQYPLALWYDVRGLREDFGFIDAATGWFMLASIGSYTALAVRRAYGNRWVGAVAAGAGLAFAMFFTLALYRVLLFFVAFAST